MDLAPCLDPLLKLLLVLYAKVDSERPYHRIDEERVEPVSLVPNRVNEHLPVFGELLRREPFLLLEMVQVRLKRLPRLLLLLSWTGFFHADRRIVRPRVLLRADTFHLIHHLRLFRLLLVLGDFIVAEFVPVESVFLVSGQVFLVLEVLGVVVV